MTLDWARDGQDWPNRAASRFVRARGLSAARELAEIAAALVVAGEREEPELLTRLTRLAAQIERRRSENMFRFSAALLPSVFLVLAPRAAVAASWWGWVALLLLAAGAAHVADLRRRAKGRCARDTDLTPAGAAAGGWRFGGRSRRRRRCGGARSRPPRWRAGP